MTQDTKTANFSTRMTPETLKLLRKNAVQDSVSQSDYLSRLIEKDTLLRARRRA